MGMRAARTNGVIIEIQTVDVRSGLNTPCLFEYLSTGELLLGVSSQQCTIPFGHRGNPA